MAISPEEFKQITQNYLLSFTKMLAIMRVDSQGRRSIIDSGSGMFLNRGVAKFLVTNSHVYDGFLRYRDEDATTSLNFLGRTAVGFSEIQEATVLGIDKDCDCDLATLSIEDPNRVVEVGRAYADFVPWTPRRVTKGMLTMMIGFAGIGAKNSVGQIPLRHVLSGGSVASVSDRQFVIHDESGETIWLCPPGKAPISRLETIRKLL